MSNERTANGTRLTRAMHRAAAALYAAGFERQREEPVIGDSEANETQNIGDQRNEVVSDISPVQHDEGGSSTEAPIVQVIGDQGIPDSSGETQR